MIATLAMVYLVAAPYLPQWLVCRELARFPDAATCNYWLVESRYHQQWIKKRACLYSQDRYNLLVVYYQQISDWQLIWEQLLAAQTEPANPKNIDRLGIIRAAIGDWNYAWGCVPLPIAGYFLAQHRAWRKQHEQAEKSRR